MPDAPLTMDAIQAMDDEALNLAIEAHCCPTHVWEHVLTDSPGRGMWQLEHPDIPGRLWSSVPHLHYTASWDRAMELRQKYGQYIDLVWTGNRQVVRTSYGTMPFIDCTTPEEVRRAICQLVLWQTLAQQAWTAEEAAYQEREAAEDNRLTNGEVSHAHD